MHSACHPADAGKSLMRLENSLCHGTDRGRWVKKPRQQWV